jgi:histone deacetylase 11
MLPKDFASFCSSLVLLSQTHSFPRQVAAGLATNGIISSNSQLVKPLPVSLTALQSAHSQTYLQQLHSSSLKVAQVTELAPLAMLPHFLVQRKVLQPMRLHVGGTVLAAGLAVAHGWAVNLGGGMHHAHRDDGSGWCPYADITLAVQRIRWVED